MRSPVGITLGWLVQVLTWASALLVPAMLGVAVVFTALWVLLLVQGTKVDRIVAEQERDAAASPCPPLTTAGPVTTERSLVLVKPDGFARGLTGEVLRRVEAKGYRLVALQVLTPDRDRLHSHYAEHQGKSFYEPLCEFMSSGPVAAAVIEGDRCVEGFRALAGATDPTNALPGTIRGDSGRVGHPRPAERRARLRLHRVGRPRDRHLVPRASDGCRSGGPRRVRPGTAFPARRPCTGAAYRVGRGWRPSLLA